MLLPEIERQQKAEKEVVFRADAAFAKPEIYEAREERGVKYAIRIPANDSLECDIAELLTRPVGRPSHKPVAWYKSFLYQAASWTTVRRVVAKVEFHYGELSPRVGLIVTNLETDSRAVVRFYNKRGTAEQWIKDGKQVIRFISEAEADIYGRAIRENPATFECLVSRATEAFRRIAFSVLAFTEQGTDHLEVARFHSTQSEDSEESRGIIAGALSLVFLHEFGHCLKGHVQASTASAGPLRGGLQAAHFYTPEHCHEFEADEFAARTFFRSVGVKSG